MTYSAFIAYPNGRPLIREPILDAATRLKEMGNRIEPWEEMPILGFKVDDLIRDKISSVDALIADITYPNQNVFYEIGYAIGCRKPVLPLVNSAVDKAVRRVQSIGFFDTLGWGAYQNADDLFDELKGWAGKEAPIFSEERKDHVQPLFVLDTQTKTDFRNHIFSAVENSRVNFRTFDPIETPRLTATQAVSLITKSSGAILPLLSEQISDAIPHSLRVGFLLGLCHGFSVEALVIQYEHAPAPLDFRDFVTNSTFRKETENHVDRFCQETLIRNQQVSSRTNKRARSLISSIDLGSTAAENETQKLPEYFVETAEYSRALRAEGAVIVGRKGSGKSAVFQQIALELSGDRKHCVVDLRPASHNLSLMRESLISVTNAGVFDHTIAAFWQYILYIEILLKIRELIIPKSRNDLALQDRIRRLEEEFSLSESVVAGDFTSRLESAVREVIETLKTIRTGADVRSQLTNAMFEKPLPKLREALVSFRDYFDGVTVLIDDLDKGWPPHHVEEPDVRMVKHLIEVLNKIHREAVKKSFDVRHLVFLRSDIYENLVEETSDRGKYNVIKIDWSDRVQLRRLLVERVKYNLAEKDFEAAWGAFNPKLENNIDAVELMIDNSLRRPRFLIDLAERTLSFAVNRGHPTVTREDVEEGLRQMSLYLVSDFGYEMRDIAGTPEDIFYLFIGAADILTFEEIDIMLKKHSTPLDTRRIINLLLWYGFLGILNESEEAVFIYDRAYDFRRLDGERSKPQDVFYVLNPAFLRGLTT